MLSRGGGVAALQRIVTRVADLPSPLDAQPGERIIVRETDEVYGLNVNTRMWEVIGTLKKVGGRRPEELGAHLDSKENPHVTSLQQVLAAGADATTDGVTLRGGPKSVLNLHGNGSVLRVGPDDGNLDGVIWVNGGARTTKDAFIRFLRNKVDQFVVEGDGTVVSTGSASFAGGFRGPAVFDDEITASEGVFGAKGFDLVLGSDKAVIVHVAGGPVLHIDDRGALIGGSLEVSRDLTLGGQIAANLNPSGKRHLGAAVARWESASIKSLDLAPDGVSPAIKIAMAANAQGHALIVATNAPGDAVVLTSNGALGLGADAPERRLDVRGDGLVVGNGPARISIDTVIGFNRGADGKPKDASVPMWAVSPGANDIFSVSRKGDVLLSVRESEIQLNKKAVVAGDLSVKGALQIAGVSSLDGKSGVSFDRTGTTYSSVKHSFVGGVSIDGPFSAGSVSLNGDNLLGRGSLGSEESPWFSAHLSSLLQVDGLSFVDGAILHEKGIVIKTPILSIGSQLHMDGALAEIHVIDVLEVKGGGANMIIGVGPYPGITFEGEKPATMYGLGHVAISSRGSNEPALSVEQTWGKGTFGAFEVSVVDEGSDPASTLADYTVNGKRVAAVRKDRVEVAGSLHVGGLAFKKLQEDVRLDGPRAETSFKIPAGVRVEAVVVTILETLSGARFVQIGDASEPDRFAGPSTELVGGSTIRGLNHCDRGLSVQKVAASVVLSADAPATGRVRVTVHYVDSAAL